MPELDDKFQIDCDRVYMTGIQALVRLCLMRAELDRRAGLNSAGYVSGYRGSPLGSIDLQFPLAERYLRAAGIVFEPGLNEELAATAIWGTQQSELRGDGIHDGVFALWYGKGPGVDRSGDALRHANLAGSSPQGGVLALAGDDHTCESSTTCHQSEFALMDAMIPVLYPSTVREILDYGLHGWELSRFAGLWCGLKGVKDNVESSASVEAGLDSFATRIPEDFSMPGKGLSIRVGDTPQAQEMRLHRHKIPAAQAYVRANGLDRSIFGGGHRFGIVTAGKSYLDTLQALDDLGIDAVRANALGLGVFKVAMTWPLEPTAIAEFAIGCQTLVVVEEKRGLIEGQIRQLLYGHPNAPAIIGKRDEKGAALFQEESALNPSQIAAEIGTRLARMSGAEEIKERAENIAQQLCRERESLVIERKPYFCAGCPHNTSTRVPEEARGYAGIGCHYMAQFMDRDVDGFTHMGGEGANWIGESKFSAREHVFQNLGDGTYNHSGLMALRAAVAAGTRMTFKILYNDAVAMTGGQAHEGGLDPSKIAAEVAAAGVRTIALVSDDPRRHSGSKLPHGVSVFHRDHLDTVQEDLAKASGVSVLIYEQTCAAELRRRRRRGQAIEPPDRIYINTRVCEGCGDCGVQSNCVAIVPVETELGRKRQIDQTACNKDYSCVKGFCPSFVRLKGASLRDIAPQAVELPDTPEPVIPTVQEQPYAIAVAGIGGTGVVTTAALIGMAAHIESLGCGIIDMAGLAQKGGAVVSHVKLARHPEGIRAIRIGDGGADLLLGCDLLVSASDSLQRLLQAGRSRIVVNTHPVMPGAFAHTPDLQLPVSVMQMRMAKIVNPEDAKFLNSTGIVESLLGDTLSSNLFLLGVAWQSGYIPLKYSSLKQAIQLNGVSVERNLLAFNLGRQWSHDPGFFEVSPDRSVSSKQLSVEEMIERNYQDLIAYQNEFYAQQYRIIAERAYRADPGKEKEFATAVARYAYKLMSYKDEYEVARLYTDGQFEKELSERFKGKPAMYLYLAPPALSGRGGADSSPRKRLYGPWVFGLLRLLAKCRSFRGTWLDPFRYSAERRMERQLAVDYRSMIENLVADHMDGNYRLLVQLAALPEQVRGYGHVKRNSVNKYQMEVSELMQLIKSSQPQQHAA